MLSLAFGRTATHADALFEVQNYCADPVISPAPAGDGRLMISELLSMACPTQESSIHYTLDGTDPTSESPTFDEDFHPSQVGHLEIRAVAVAPGYLESSVASRQYEVYHPCEPVVFRRENGSIRKDGDLMVPTELILLTCATEGATIFYTLDESDPVVPGVVGTDEREVVGGENTGERNTDEDEEDDEYEDETFAYDPNEALSFDEEGEFTIKVVVVAPGRSEMRGRLSVVVSRLRCADPTITPVRHRPFHFAGDDGEAAAGDSCLEIGQEVVLECSTEGAVVYYSFDGSIPRPGANGNDPLVYDRTKAPLSFDALGPNTIRCVVTGRQDDQICVYVCEGGWGAGGGVICACACACACLYKA